MTIPEVIYGPLVEAVAEERDLYASIRCPSCGSVGWIAQDQYEGSVSIGCPNESCDYHETHDLREGS